MVRKTKAEALETREHLLDAAEQLFLSQGVARTSLQHVAAAAGLTRGAVYWHFQDKADLFEAMVQRVALPCETAMAEALAAPDAAVMAGLLGLALVPMREVCAQPRVQRVFTIMLHHTEMAADMQAVQQRHIEGVGTYIDQMRQLIERARGLGLIDTGQDPAAAALGLFALVDGLLRHWTLTPGSFDLVAVGEATVGAYLRGLASPGRRAPVTG